MLTVSHIRSQLDAAGRDPQRSRGQNFLTDGNLASALVRACDVEPGETALEIGPGLGSLTLPLAHVAAQVIAIEIDPHLVPLLQANLHQFACENVQVIIGDARTTDLATLPNPPTLVVGNLPYNIGTQLTLDLLERVPTARRVVVTVQREVAERLTAAPRTKAYGAVSVKVAAYGHARLVAHLPPTVFFPRPNVDSATVRIDRVQRSTADDRAAIWPLIESGFAHRRKTLRHSLSAVLSDVRAQCTAAGIDHGARAEELRLEDWLSLAQVRANWNEPPAKDEHAG